MGQGDPGSQHQAGVRLSTRERAAKSCIPQHLTKWRIVTWTSESGGRSLKLIEPPSQSDRAFNPLHRRTFSSVLPLSHRSMSGVRRCVMVETVLAYDLSKTRAICDAFDDAWGFLQGLGSDLTEASK